MEISRMTTYDLVNCDPEIMSGTPVFRGTRVPIKALFDYLEGDETLKEFLDDFPTVERSQAVALLNLAQEMILQVPAQQVQ
jgi:uncharacterized protein (DUF433 family)